MSTRQFVKGAAAVLAALLVAGPAALRAEEAKPLEGKLSAVFIGFENKATDLKYVRANRGSSLTIVAKHKTGGNSALKVSGGNGAGVNSSWYYFGAGFPRDWSNAGTFAFSAVLLGRLG